MRGSEGHATIKSALKERGYTYQRVTLGGRLYHEYLAPSGWVWRYGQRFRAYPFITIAARNISTDKQASYDFAKLHNVSTPATIAVHNADAALQFLKDHRRVIVKPTSQSGGVGVTVDITSEHDLRSAISFATGDQNDPVLVQRQFIGEEVRFTVLNGKVASAILRQTPRVVGDGVSTIAELIDRENQTRRDLQFPSLTYPLLDEKIIPKHFIKSEHIPAKDEIIELNKSTMIRKGASFYGVMEQVHASYIGIAERLAYSLNPAMLVVDLMIEDFRRPATADNYVFIEFNTAPAPQIYTSIRGGDTPPVIDWIAQMIDEYRTDDR
jgi:D-alanine-D-alanine ligase-like ATP-grasp enzyme